MYLVLSMGTFVIADMHERRYLFLYLAAHDSQIGTPKYIPKAFAFGKHYITHSVRMGWNVFLELSKFNYAQVSIQVLPSFLIKLGNYS